MVKRRCWNVATNQGRSVRGLKGRPVGQDIMFPDMSGRLKMLQGVAASIRTNLK